MEPDDFWYPVKLTKAPAKGADFEKVLDGLLKRAVDEYVLSPPAWFAGPAGRWVLQLKIASWRAPEIADIPMLVPSDIESVVATLQEN